VGSYDDLVRETAGAVLKPGAPAEVVPSEPPLDLVAVGGGAGRATTAP
jgi:hypothetical protein